MQDFEKIIKWLEYDYLPRVGAYRKDCKQGCDACMSMHDGDDYCDIDMLCKVLALLKEQEAHLLDVSEIYTAHKLDVWIEEKGDNTVHPLMLVETEMTDKRQAAFFFPMTVRPVKAYGKTWRCWSARPTDEQRKAMKWITG